MDFLEYFAFGTTLASLTNFEAILAYKPPHVLPDGVIPLLSKETGVTLSQKSDRSGRIDAVLYWDSLSGGDYNTLIYALFGDFLTGSVRRYVTSIDETRHWSPFLCTFKKPDIGDDYSNVSRGWTRELKVTLRECKLQSVTKTTTATLTASERLAYGDTTGGGFTITLPAASAVGAGTVVSVEKSAVANTLTVSRAGTDKINGVNTVALTALHSRYDLASDGAANWITV